MLKVLQRIVGSGEVDSLQRLQQTVRALAETRFQPRDNLHWLERRNEID
jgi:hypothetical protein